jgi:hypothetical protein
MARNSRELQHLKSSRTTTKKGIPRHDEGSDGDLTLRLTNTGLKLFAKYQNRWYIVGEYMKEAVLDERRMSHHQVHAQSPASLTRNGDLSLQSGRAVSFDGDKGKVSIGGDPDTSGNNRDILVKVQSGALKIEDDGVATGTPQLLLKSNSDTGSGGFLGFIKDRDGVGGTANDDGDTIGGIIWQGFDSATPPNPTQFVNISGYALDTTSDTEAGKLMLSVATKTSGGSTIADGIILLGSDTNNEVDVSIGKGTASMTTIAGNLDIDGNKITSAGALEIETGGSGGLTLDVAGNVTIDADGGYVYINDTSPAAFSPSLWLKSTDTGNEGPYIFFQQDTSDNSPAAGDVLGGLAFYGDDVGGAITNYTSILSKISSTAAGAEEGQMIFMCVAGGAIREGYKMTANGSNIDVQVGYGATSTTTITGNLDIDGAKITSVGALEIDPGGQLSVTGQDMSVDSTKKVIFGDAGEYIVGDGTDLNIVSSGHVEFDGCGVGFDKETTAFTAAAVTSEGNDSTDIDFRLGNKHELTLSDNIAGSGEHINMIFPATSGNFILALIQDSSGSRTVHSDGWKAYASDASLCDNTLGANGTDGEVRWPGGTAPTLTTGARKTDIISIYWDADNQTACCVASLNF